MRDFLVSASAVIRIWRLAQPPRRLVLLAVGVIVLGGFLRALPIQWLRVSIDDVMRHAATPRTLALYVGLWYACYLFAALTGMLSSYLATRLAASISHTLRVRVHDHLLHLSPVLTESQAHGDLLNRVLDDSHYLGQMLVSPLSTMTGAVATFAWAGYFLGRIHVGLTVLLMLATPLGIGVAWHLWRRTRAVWAQHRVRSARLWDLVLENLAGGSEIQAFGHEDDRAQLVAAASDQYRGTEVATAMVSAGVTTTFSIVAPVGAAAVLGVGLWLVQHGTLTIGSVASFAMYGWLLMEPLSNACRQYETLQRGFASGVRVLEVLALPVGTFGVDSPVAEQPLPVEFRDVSYSYPGSKLMALSGVSFQISAGEVAAIVGHSGAGKSTVLKLLLRFCDPSTGTIFLGSDALQGLATSRVRASMSVVFQQPFLFAMSLRDNVLFGAAECGADTGPRFAAATRLADLGSFEETLPDGWETEVGRSGAGLSHGEKERVTIARAAMRDAPVLIWDEATASADVATEQRIRSALERLRGSRTCVLITHHSSLAAVADKVIFLEKGRTKAIGTHQSLLATCPEYRSLFAIEASSDPAFAMRLQSALDSK